VQEGSEAKRHHLASLITSYRPLLQQLEALAIKDQGTKKKRIWRRDKDNTAALDQLHRQLDFRTQSLDLYLPTLRTSQLALIEQRLEAFVEEFKRGAPGTPRGVNALDDESEADAQWSALRRQLLEEGITDVDIEAHKSSIRALLQERLPSYYEAHIGSAQPEANDTPVGSREATSGPQNGPSLVREPSNHASSRGEEDKPRTTQTPLGDPGHIPSGSQGEDVHSASLLSTADSQKRSFT
jgi:hypothetical protein